MSTVGQMKTSIINALKLLPALSGVDVVPGAMPEDVWFLSNGNPLVMVVYGGLEAVGATPNSPRLQTGTAHTFIIVTSASGYRSGTESQVMTGGADDLAEAVRGIRATDIGPTGQAHVRLLLRSEQLMEHPDRTAVGGPIAYACMYQTTAVTV